MKIKLKGVYMLRILLIFSAIISLFFITFSCKAKNLNSESFEGTEKNVIHQGIEGLVEVYGDDVYIVINPDCKCRKSLKVLGDKKEELKKLKGLFVEVEGDVKFKTPWSGEIIVEKIFRLEK